MFSRNKIEDGTFQTSDIDMVTALSLDFPIVDAKASTTNARRVIFSFEDTEEVRNYVKRYEDKEILVEPKRFYYQIRDIRSRINNLLDS